MSIFKGTTEPKKIYIRVDTPVVDFLLIGGGGVGGNGYSSNSSAGGGGGAGGVIYCTDYTIPSGSYNVVIGGCGTGDVIYSNANGKPSCFGEFVACGGGHGGGWCVANYRASSVDAASGGSGGGATEKMVNNSWTGAGVGGGCVEGQGNCGGNVPACQCGVAAAGGGGYGSQGCSVISPAIGGNGGIGIMSDIDGEMKCYAGGGGGGAYAVNCQGCGQYGGGNGGNCYSQYGCPATTCGSGGGGSSGYGGRVGGNGACGVFIIRYKTGDYNMTGGTKYTCGDYTIHCFTSNGTLTVN